MDFFPPLTLWDTKDRHAFHAVWFSSHLHVMEEKPIFNIELASDSMVGRFLWLRTFHQPVMIRMEIHPNGLSLLHTKITDGKGGYEAGKVIYNERNKLSSEHFDTIKAYLVSIDYWNMEPFTREIWLDGAAWIFELRTSDNYKIVRRTSPRGQLYQEFCLYLLQLANVEVENIY